MGKWMPPWSYCGKKAYQCTLLISQLDPQMQGYQQAKARLTEQRQAWLEKKQAYLLKQRNYTQSARNKTIAKLQDKGIVVLPDEFISYKYLKQFNVRLQTICVMMQQCGIYGDEVVSAYWLAVSHYLSLNWPYDDPAYNFKEMNQYYLDFVQKAGCFFPPQWIDCFWQQTVTRYVEGCLKKNMAQSITLTQYEWANNFHDNWKYWQRKKGNIPFTICQQCGVQVPMGKMYCQECLKIRMRKGTQKGISRQYALREQLEAQKQKQKQAQYHKQIRKRANRKARKEAATIQPLEEVERKKIIAALRVAESKEQAAEKLGIGIATLYRKIKKYHISKRQYAKDTEQVAQGTQSEQQDQAEGNSAEC